jgi:hypothetical protein
MEKGILRFANCVFNPGLNVTVRKGDKWNGPRRHVTIGNTEGSLVTAGEIIQTFTTTVVGLVGNFWLQFEHDPFCREFEGIFFELQRVYPGITLNDEVTIVLFTVNKKFITWKKEE